MTEQERVVDKQYVTGQKPIDVLDFQVKEKTLDELTLAEAEKLVLAGHLPTSMLAERMGYGPAHRPNIPCHDPNHDHHEIRSLQGAVRRTCVPRR